MTLLGELRTRARHIVGPVLAATVFAYFAYHAVQGDRGLLAWVKLSQQVQDAQMEYEKLDAKRADLARRVHLMHPESLDRDLLDERVRVMLGYVGKDDMVIGTGLGSRVTTGAAAGGSADPVTSGTMVSAPGAFRPAPEAKAAAGPTAARTDVRIPLGG